LLPHRCLNIGWGLLAASVVGAIAVVVLGSISVVSHNVEQAVYLATMLMFYVSLLLLSISREKNEDEYITALRGRIVCIVVGCALALKIIVQFLTTICLSTHNLALLGRVRFLNIPTDFVVLVVAYIVIFKITLFIANRRLKNYAE